MTDAAEPAADRTCAWCSASAPSGATLCPACGAGPAQGLASGAIVAAVAGGPAGLIALGGIVAVAAVEYLGGRNPDGSGPQDLESVGRLSGTAQLVLDRIAREGEPAPSQGSQTPEEGPASA